MPIYEYYCPSCKSRSEKLRPMAEMDLFTACSQCGKAARRVLSVFAAVVGDRVEQFEGSAEALGGGGGGGCCGGGGCACS